MGGCPPLPLALQPLEGGRDLRDHAGPAALDQQQHQVKGQAVDPPLQHLARLLYPARTAQFGVAQARRDACLLPITGADLEVVDTSNLVNGP